MSTTLCVVTSPPECFYDKSWLMSDMSLWFRSFTCLLGGPQDLTVTMIVTQRLRCHILLSWVLFLRVGAQRNITLDDQDTSIVYAPPTAWSQTDRSSLDHGGAHMLTSEPGATATFKFTGGCTHSISSSHAVISSVS